MISSRVAGAAPPGRIRRQISSSVLLGETPASAWRSSRATMPQPSALGADGAERSIAAPGRGGWTAGRLRHDVAASDRSRAMMIDGRMGHLSANEDRGTCAQARVADTRAALGALAAGGAAGQAALVDDPPGADRGSDALVSVRA